LPQRVNASTAILYVQFEFRKPLLEQRCSCTVLVPAYTFICPHTTFHSAWNDAAHNLHKRTKQNHRRRKNQQMTQV